ncbi:Polyphosphate phosphatase [Komagataella phaffii CBS 7435]|uniref:Polyphosphate phosphatase n=2 Tax=Komagataella phaffii TaxID=460519 RepID=C4R434_KOMPG|nr:Polyphosphate phosphatase [Komagataella phaffii GS115]AOA63336.1 GQ67_03335T0 [Komagataella phaffii]KAI0463999.1 hypothetical protein LJB42_003012 [Komagataella kurtzmanii]CAH2449936.1 Polyphosphate phosphatase [Komagataella phaffii CBS 7435]AOA69123.1 GQ68_03304T0 [Komagataella phaffii GS115]CAY70320.1 Polyphosphate phosphatase [Komagataella phaffii GS115]
MAAEFVPLAVAREGRESQLYSKTSGARLIAGCVPLNEAKDKVIMISSSKHKDRWILPKGGIEKDEEDDYRNTALRETWEEAGIFGEITKKLKVVFDHRFQKGSGDLKEKDLDIDGERIPRSEFHLYEMIVRELSQEWPESAKRERKWCTYSEAKHELTKSKRWELLDALNDSSIEKDVQSVFIDQKGNHKDAAIHSDHY